MLREVRDWFEDLACRAGVDGLPSPGRTVTIGLSVAAAAVLVWVLWGSSAGHAAITPESDPVRGESTRTVEASAAAPAAPTTITVHVVGEVRRPGVYQLLAGARAQDAVQAAGGLLGDAEQAAVNLARPVQDGEQIAVPRQGEVTVAAAGGTAPGAVGSVAAAGGKVDLNTATAEQLDALPGVGPSTAAKIVSDRTANGPFRNVDDLMRVSGIGPAKFDGLKDLVSAN